MHTIPQLQAARLSLVAMLAELRNEESSIEARTRELTIEGISLIIAIANIEESLLDCGIIPEQSTENDNI